MKCEHKSRIERKQEAYFASGGGTGQDTRIRKTIIPREPRKAPHIGRPRFVGTSESSLFFTAVSQL